MSSFTVSLTNSWDPFIPDNAIELFQVAADQNLDTPQTAAEADEAFSAIIELAPDAELVPVGKFVDVERPQEFRENGATDDSEAPGEFDFIPIQVEALQSNGATVSGTVSPSTPELLRAMGVDSVNPDVDLITTYGGALDVPEGVVVQRVALVARVYPSIVLVGELPGFNLSQSRIEDWIFINDAPFTQEQLVPIEIASLSDDRVFANLPDTPPPFVAIRATALVVAILLASGIVASSVALLRMEAEGEDRTFAAIGTSPRMGRSIAAASTAGLTLAAVVAAVPSALLVLAGVYLDPDDSLRFAVPWIELGLMFIGLPIIFAGAAWLLRGTPTPSVRAT